MLTSESQLHLTLLVFVVGVAIVDWRTHRIPNLLCLTAAILGLSLQLWSDGGSGLLTALAGAGIGFAMFLPFYAVRAFGAGDVKAMATVGIFLGAKGTMLAVGLTLTVGAVLGLLVLSLKPTRVGATLQHLTALLTAPVATLRNSQQTPESSERFPYGMAIACGTWVALLVMNG